MKIGILTFHRAHNYGAFLQTYALQEYLKRFGDVYIIDYSPIYFKRSYGVINTAGFCSLPLLRKLRRIIGWLILCIPRLYRYRGFNHDINKELNLSYKQYISADMLTDLDYDVIVFGSDQIWNWGCTFGFDRMFLGDFDFAGKRVAYAASAGDNFFGLEENEKAVKKALDKFNAISVRESALGNFLNGRFKICAVTVLDPTLLLTREQWLDWCKPVEKENTEPYVLLYVVRISKEAEKIASRIAKQKGIKVKCIYAFMGSNPKTWMLSGCSPKKFTALFRDAAFVVTTSFHGTAFAVNFQKEFYVVNDNKPNCRIEHLLSMCSLKDRYISDCNEICLSKQIKWNSDALMHMRAVSDDFLIRNCSC